MAVNEKPATGIGCSKTVSFPTDREVRLAKVLEGRCRHFNDGPLLSMKIGYPVPDSWVPESFPDQ